MEVKLKLLKFVGKKVLVKLLEIDGIEKNTETQLNYGYDIADELFKHLEETVIVEVTELSITKFIKKEYFYTEEEKVAIYILESNNKQMSKKKFYNELSKALGKSPRRCQDLLQKWLQSNSIPLQEKDYNTLVLMEPTPVKSFYTEDNV